MIRLGLIGAADPRHRWFLAAAQRRRAGIRIADFSEPDAALRQDVALLYNLPGQADHRALLAEATPSLAAVAQHPGTAQVVLDVLRHDVDVVVVPPVCDTLSELETIAGLAFESGRRVTAAHTYRGHPAGCLAKELVDNGRLGRVELVSLIAASDRNEPELRRAKLEGLDLFLWLTGATAGAVSAVTDDRHPARREDPPDIRAAFGELTMIATATSRTGQPDVIFEVRRRPNATTPEVIQIAGSTGAIEWDVRAGVVRSALTGADPVTVSCGWLDQPAEWVLNNLLRRRLPVISTEHSLATTRILLLAERSRQLDGEVQAWQF